MSRAQNEGESAICPMLAQPSVEIVRGVREMRESAGLHFRLTLFVPPSALKENLESGGCFSLGYLPWKLFMLMRTLACLHLDTYTCMLALGCFHLQTFTWILQCHCNFNAIVSIEV